MYPRKSYWSYFRYPWILLHYFVILVGLVLFGLMTPDQSSAVQKVLQSLPCLPQDSYKLHIFVLADDHTYHLVLIVIYIVATSTEASFFVTFTIWHTATQFRTKIMSQKTYQMQKTFFKTLLVQMTVPAVMLIIPMIYALIVVVRDIHNQSLTNICIIIASLHGFVSTIVMLFVHRPYRKELFHFFTRSSHDSVAPCRNPVFVLN
ncbi:Protein CBG26951 [Caenorhabditis briggsae]|uniref:Protein CBG26951 n=1 Tax=Caenorhabditis briggsae TaxID=6238 RepID=B6IHU4_CAEBR|nr:Protein CBG26951 [Caenorhabditis briggsae]CAR99474.1 Protein CBG26951 [Caenorhabditis briggsae]